MKSNKLYFSALISILLLFSCQRFLDVKSDYSKTLPETTEDLQKLLDRSQTMNLQVPSLSEVSSDDYFLDNETFLGMVEQPRQAYLWQIKPYKFPNDWATTYTPIYVANLVLQRLIEIDEDSELGDRLRGSALFYRSFQLLCGIWTYGNAYDPKSAEKDLGMVLRLTANPTAVSVRSSVQQTYDRIITDLREAVNLLPDKSVHSMRPSVSAANALLARAYLSMAKYDSAFVFADRCLQIKDELLDFNDENDVNLLKSFPFSQFNKETIYYAEFRLSNPNIHPAYAAIDSNLFEDFSVDDLRKQAYFSQFGKYVHFRGSYSSNNNFFAGIATDEVYLIRAEANIQLGKNEEALDDLNKLLESRWKRGSFVPYHNLTREQTLELVRKERRKELVMRGIRWSDIKRINRESNSITLYREINGERFELKANDKRFALPLPEDIVKITGIPQNP